MLLCHPAMRTTSSPYSRREWGIRPPTTLGSSEMVRAECGLRDPFGRLTVSGPQGWPLSSACLSDSPLAKLGVATETKHHAAEGTARSSQIHEVLKSRYPFVGKPNGREADRSRNRSACEGPPTWYRGCAGREKCASLDVCDCRARRKSFRGGFFSALRGFASRSGYCFAAS